MMIKKAKGQALMPDLFICRGNSVPACRAKKSLRNIQIHKNEMTDTAAHDEQMKDLMGTEVTVPAVKNRELQRIDDTARRINDAACKQP